MTESPANECGTAASARRALAVATLLGAIACGGDGPTSNDDPPSNGTITATVDGQAWSSSMALASRIGNGFVSVGGNSGISGDISNISMGFPEEIGTHTIPIPAGMNFSYSIYTPTQVWQALAMGEILGGSGTGTVTVTTLNAERIAGTFSFVALAAATSEATGTRTVTNGAFDVRF